MGAPRSLLRWSFVITMLVCASPAHAQVVLVENFNDNVLDESRWTVLDPNNDGTTIDETGGRLEFSTNGFAGSSGIFSNGWALSTDEDIKFTIDYNLTVPFTGSAAIGLNFTMFQGGDPGLGQPDDRIDFAIFRQGNQFFVQWFFYANGQVIDQDFGISLVNDGRIYFFFDQSTDRTWISSIGFGNQADSIRIDDVVAQTSADFFQLYLGGFQNATSVAVDGDDAWGDTLRVTRGELINVGPVNTLELDSRNDADWFRRGDSGGDRLGLSARFIGDVDSDGRSDMV
ncbi:MAG: hypothetical protein ACYTGC_02065, partial [Planctomycetota bacterium]